MMQSGGSYAGCSTDVAYSACPISGQGAAYGSHDFWQGVVPKGSGGSPGYNTAGGAGGAGIIITAQAGTLTINGSVIADGAAGAVSSAANYAGGGGSGGSIRLIADTMGVSTGTVRATGGDGAVSNFNAMYNGLGGSGGRIAVYARSSNMPSNVTAWPLPLQAFGGLAGAPTTVATAASPGTVYVDAGGAAISPTLLVRNRLGAPLRPVHVIAASNRQNITLGNVDAHDNIRVLLTPVVANPRTFVLIDSITGDSSGGKVVISNSVTATIGIYNFQIFTDDTKTSLQFISSTEQQMLTTTKVYSHLGLIQGSDVDIQTGGILSLPGSVYVCNSTLTAQSGSSVTGSTNITWCDSHPTKQIQGTGGVVGCKNATALNYAPSATVDDPSSCVFAITGCTYRIATNYQPTAQFNDGSCKLAPGLVLGCTSPCAFNYARNATFDDGTCVFPDRRFGCTYAAAFNPTKGSNTDDGSCRFPDFPTLYNTIDMLWTELNATADLLAVERNRTAYLNVLLHDYWYPSSTPTASSSWTASSTASATASLSASSSVSATASASSSVSATASATSSPSSSMSASGGRSATATTSMSRSFSPSASQTGLPLDPEVSMTPTWSVTPSASPSSIGSAAAFPSMDPIPYEFAGLTDGSGGASGTPEPTIPPQDLTIPADGLLSWSLTLRSSLTDVLDTLLGTAAERFQYVPSGSAHDNSTDVSTDDDPGTSMPDITSRVAAVDIRAGVAAALGLPVSAVVIASANESTVPSAAAPAVAGSLNSFSAHMPLNAFSRPLFPLRLYPYSGGRRRLQSGGSDGGSSFLSDGSVKSVTLTFNISLPAAVQLGHASLIISRLQLSPAAAVIAPFLASNATGGLGLIAGSFSSVFHSPCSSAAARAALIAAGNAAANTVVGNAPAFAIPLSLIGGIVVGATILVVAVYAYQRNKQSKGTAQRYLSRVHPDRTARRRSSATTGAALPGGGTNGMARRLSAIAGAGLASVVAAAAGNRRRSSAIGGGQRMAVGPMQRLPDENAHPAAFTGDAEGADPRAHTPTDTDGGSRSRSGSDSESGSSFNGSDSESESGSNSSSDGGRRDSAIDMASPGQLRLFSSTNLHLAAEQQLQSEEQQPGDAAAAQLAAAEAAATTLNPMAGRRASVSLTPVVTVSGSATDGMTPLRKSVHASLPDASPSWESADACPSEAAKSAAMPSKVLPEPADATLPENRMESVVSGSGSRAFAAEQDAGTAADGSLAAVVAKPFHVNPIPVQPAAEDTSAPLPELSPEAELAALQELSALTGAAAGAGPARRATSSRRLMSGRNLSSAAGSVRLAAPAHGFVAESAAEGSDALPAAMLATGGARARPKLMPLGGGASAGAGAVSAVAVGAAMPGGAAANGVRFGGAPLLSSRSFRMHSSRTGSRLANAGRVLLGPDAPPAEDAGVSDVPQRVPTGVALPRAGGFGGDASTAEVLSSPGFASPTAGSDSGFGSPPSAKPLSGMRIGSTRRLLASSASPSWRVGVGESLAVPPLPGAAAVTAPTGTLEVGAGGSSGSRHSEAHLLVAEESRGPTASAAVDSAPGIVL
jgi:hypothetical protein